MKKVQARLREHALCCVTRWVATEKMLFSAQSGGIMRNSPQVGYRLGGIGGRCTGGLGRGGGGISIGP